MSESSQQPPYSMVIEWSDEDQVYVVSFPEWGDLAHTHGATYDEAVRQGQEVLELLTASAREQGKPLPRARIYRGNAAGA
jgi:predicted RNase H-like HicB family nuclease